MISLFKKAVAWIGDKAVPAVWNISKKSTSYILDLVRDGAEGHGFAMAVKDGFDIPPSNDGFAFVGLSSGLGFIRNLCKESSNKFLKGVSFCTKELLHGFRHIGLFSAFIGGLAIVDPVTATALFGVNVGLTVGHRVFHNLKKHYSNIKEKAGFSKVAEAVSDYFFSPVISITDRAGQGGLVKVVVEFIILVLADSGKINSPKAAESKGLSTFIIVAIVLEALRIGFEKCKKNVSWYNTSVVLGGLIAGLWGYITITGAQITGNFENPPNINGEVTDLHAGEIIVYSLVVAILIGIKEALVRGRKSKVSDARQSETIENEMLELPMTVEQGNNNLLDRTSDMEFAEPSSAQKMQLGLGKSVSRELDLIEEGAPNRTSSTTLVRSSTSNSRSHRFMHGLTEPLLSNADSDTFLPALPNHTPLPL